MSDGFPESTANILQDVGRERVKLSSRGAVIGVGFGKVDRRVVIFAAAEDGRVRAVDTSGRPVATVESEGRLRAFSVWSDHLALASDGQDLRAFETGRLPFVPTHMAAGGPVAALAWLHGGAPSLAALIDRGYDGSAIRVIESRVHTLATSERLPGRLNRLVYAASDSPRGYLVAAGPAGVFMWPEPFERQPTQVMEFPRSAMDLTWLSAAVVAGSLTVAVVVDGFVRLRSEADRLPREDLALQRAPATCAEFVDLGDSRVGLAVGDMDGGIAVWRLADRLELIWRAVPRGASITALACRRWGSSVQIAAGNSSGELIIFRLRDPSAALRRAADDSTPRTGTPEHQEEEQEPARASEAAPESVDAPPATPAPAAAVTSDVVPEDDLAPPATPAPTAAEIFRRDELGLADDERSTDTLGRDSLARHAVGVIRRLTLAEQRGDARSGTAVVSIDGRWGAGKTVLADLIAGHLNKPAAERGTDADGQSPELRAHTLANPIVIEFDAWRESSVGPRWWTLAAAVKRGVEGERSLAAVAALFLVSATSRLLRSKAILFAALCLVIAGLAVTSGAAVSASNDGLWAAQLAAWEGASKVVGGIGAMAAIVLALGRVLFWSAPSIGRLSLNTDNDPLKEVSGIVARLRRWSPRSGSGQRARDTSLAIVCVAAVAWCVGRLLESRSARDVPGLLDLAEYVLSPGVLPAAMAAAVAIALAWLGFARPPSSRAGKGETPPREPAPALTRPAFWFWKLALPAVSGVGVGAVVFVWKLPPGCEQWAVPIAAAAIVAAVVLYLGSVAAYRRVPRRPILLILDELDRCSAEHTVEYLETVHTLMRLSTPPRLFRHWRHPAALIILVPADSRWIRTAFESQYPEFSCLEDPTRKLGADFLLKLFDHTVIVPDLTVEQVRGLTDTLTGSGTVEESPLKMLPADDDVGESEDVEALPGEAGDSETGDLGDQFEQAGASEELAEERAMHLVANYPDLMPANPRLIKRVVNTMGMLDTLGTYLGETRDDDVLARASVFFIRFPTLVDELLTTQSPVTCADLGAKRLARTWGRADVQAVLRLGDGSILEPSEVGRCFGRIYPATPAEPGPRSTAEEATAAV